MSARGEIFIFLLRKTANDLRLREGRGRGRLRLITDAADMMIGGRRERTLWRILREER
jgi:hypothetical protein